jgi:hypothetical protein
MSIGHAVPELSQFRLVMPYRHQSQLFPEDISSRNGEPQVVLRPKDRKGKCPHRTACS